MDPALCGACGPGLQPPCVETYQPLYAAGSNPCGQVECCLPVVAEDLVTGQLMYGCEPLQLGCYGTQSAAVLEANRQRICELRQLLAQREREHAIQAVQERAAAAAAAEGCRAPGSSSGCGPSAGSSANQRRIEELRLMLAQGGGTGTPHSGLPAAPSAGRFGQTHGGDYGGGTPSLRSSPRSLAPGGLGPLGGAVFSPGAAGGSYGGSGGGGAWHPYTEWEKWDDKAVRNPQLVTPEELGYQTAVKHVGARAAYGRPDFRPVYRHEGSGAYGTTA
eukprot:TRINITY_DN25185_c0_g1_i1.p2 TRINITY_DN25185_c0_g1~~TRINITY_DN25185_c0_g1_i1.p2  ORF type:complete len:301 (+),score=99.03 TRINITY_DN25185_c0_g1_i1:77-904(+)